MWGIIGIHLCVVVVVVEYASKSSSKGNVGHKDMSSAISLYFTQLLY